MHRKCLLQHLVWAGTQEMIIVTHHHFLLFIGLSKGPLPPFWGSQTFSASVRTGKASQPGAPEANMGLSPGSLWLGLPHLAAISQDSLIHSAGVYSILDLMLRKGLRDESGSSRSHSLGERQAWERSEDTVGRQLPWQEKG